MAKDLRGLYQNNRRREVNAVTVSVPYVLTAADLREGTAAVVATSAAYTTLTIPGGALITGVSLIVEKDVMYGTGSTAQVKIGGIEVVAATAIDAAGATASTAVPILIEGLGEDVEVTLVVAGTPNEKAVARVVITYADYDLATVSFIGEE